MRTRENVPQPMKDSLRGELVGILVGELNLTQDEASRIDLGEFRRDTREFYSSYRKRAGRMDSALISWGATYKRLFGKIPELSGVVIPTKPEGVGPVRLIVVAEELLEWTGGRPIQGVQNALNKHFPTWQYENDLDATITKNDRARHLSSYAIWVRDVREADEKYANMSVNDLAGAGGQWITILERQLMEADYTWERGEQLDIQSVTLCAGSRSRDGYVPFARWVDAEFSVGCCRVADSDPGLCARRVWA